MVTAPKASRRSLAALLLTAAAAAVCAFQFITLHAVSPLDVPLDEWLVQSLDVPAARGWVAPLLGSADGSGLQPRVLLGRAALALGGCTGLDAVAALLALAAALALALAARALGSRWLPAAAAALTLIASGALRAPSAVATGLAWQTLLAALVLLLGLTVVVGFGFPLLSEAVDRGRVEGSRIRSGLASRFSRIVPSHVCLVAMVAALAIAIDGQPAWVLLAIPAGTALLAAGGSLGSVRRGRLFAVCAALLLVAVLHAVVATALAVAAMPSDPGQLAAVRSDPGSLAAMSADAGRFPGPVPRAAPTFRLAVETAVLGAHWTGLSFGALAAGLQRFLRQVFAAWGLLGVVFALLGTVAAARLHTRALLAIVVGFLGVGFVLAVVPASPDAAPGALLSFLSIAVLAAAGGTWLFDHVGRRTRGGRTVAAVIVVLPPLLHLFAPRPPSRPFEAAAGAAYADAVWQAVARDGIPPARGLAIVSDIAPLDRLVLPAGTPSSSPRSANVVRLPRDPAIVARFVSAGYAVYAFPRARRELAAHGLWFTERPLAHATLGRYLDTLPRGTIVAMALSGGSSAAVKYSPFPVADRIGGTRRSRSSATPSVCLLGRAGAATGAVEAIALPQAAVNARAGEPIGRTRGASPVTLSLAANQERAWIGVAHRGEVEADAGLAVAVLDDAGDFVDTPVADATTGVELRVPREALSFARIDAAGECIELSPGQARDVSALARNGRFGWSIGASGAGPSRLPVSVELWWPEGHRQILLEARPAWGEVRLGFLPGALTAATRSGAPPVRLCALPAVEHLLFEIPQQQAATIDIAGDEASFGPGWYPHEREQGIPFRWASGEAQVLVRVDSARNVRLTVSASPAPDKPAGDLAVAVNGRSFEGRPLSPGTNRYEWTLPSDAWRPGLNIVALRFSQTVQLPGDPRVRAAAVRQIRFDTQ